MFKVASPLGKNLSKLLDLFLLQIYFLITSIPVFTIGAGLTAMFSVCRRIQNEDQTAVTREYFTAFKASFGQATVAWMAISCAGALLGISFSYYHRLETTARLFPMGLACLLLVVDAALFIYLFALMAWFDNSLKQHFRNAAVLAVYHWKTTLLVASLYAFTFLLVIRVIPFLSLIAISGCTFYASMLLRKVFAQHSNIAAEEPNCELAEYFDK